MQNSVPEKLFTKQTDPLVEALKIADFNSENSVQIQYHSGRESTASARDLAPSSECYSNPALS